MPMLLRDADFALKTAAPGYAFDPVANPRTPLEYLLLDSFGFFKHLLASFASILAVFRSGVIFTILVNICDC